MAEQPGEAVRVFVSSTYLDNAERRKVVEDAVLVAGMVPVGMERFTASERPTVEKCQQLARQCEVLVCIVAHRYGWIPEGHEVSITELEYRAARAAGRSCFVFQLDRELPVHPAHDFDEGPDRWDKQKKLEQFRAALGADQMPAQFQDTTLGTRVLEALNEWKRERAGQREPSIAASASGPASREADELASYREVAESLHSTLALAGFKTRLRVPLDLEELYVPLSAMVDLRGVGAAEFPDAHEAQRQFGDGGHEVPAVQALSEAERRKRRGVVILGDPGSGKTTHLKRLLLWCLRKGGAELGLPEDVVPVYLPLRELRDLSLGLDAFIEQQLDSPHLDMPEGFGKRLLARGQLLLLFDGLDEVADPEERVKVTRWIEEAARARPNCRVVVSCRFAGYGGDARLGEDFLELHLRPLSREQSEQFIRNWYRIVERGLARTKAQGELDARQKAEALVQRLRQGDFRSARLVEMTRNPLLLANLCLVHRDRGALPRGRAQLYSECIDVLLERWREGKGLVVGINAEQGRRALQPAALWLHAEQGRARASAEELAPVLRPALSAVQWKGGDASDFLRTVRDDSGLLTGWGQTQYGFMHLGFQEYLAASEIRRWFFEGDHDVLCTLAARFGESWWQEVILILVALGNPSLFAPLMREVVKQPAFAHSDELLGMLLEDAAEVSEEPFVELLRQAPSQGPELWGRQLSALRVLEKLEDTEATLQALSQEELAGHPSDELRRWAARRAQEYSPAADGRAVVVTDNGGVELVPIPGGSFLMGSPGLDDKGLSRERPQHEVTLSPFYLGRYPVTNEEYGRFLEANPDEPEPAFWSNRRFNQARQPVVGVSWEQAQRFCQWAGGRLPTEAEWEYACRARTTESQYGELDEIAWHGGNSGKQLHLVGEKQPNEWGLHDMLGNAWEWCLDGRRTYTAQAQTDPRGPEQGEERVVRGGSWSLGGRLVRSACRDWRLPANRYGSLGFRLSRGQNQPGPKTAEPSEARAYQ